MRNSFKLSDGVWLFRRYLQKSPSFMPWCLAKAWFKRFVKEHVLRESQEARRHVNLHPYITAILVAFVSSICTCALISFRQEAFVRHCDIVFLCISVIAEAERKFRKEAVAIARKTPMERYNFISWMSHWLKMKYMKEYKSNKWITWNDMKWNEWNKWHEWNAWNKWHEWN